MENEFTKVKATITKLHDLQTSHLEAFTKKDLPDLEEQSAERSIEMGKLIKSINGFVKMAENGDGAVTKPMMVSLNKKVMTLLDQNNLLEKKVQNFKTGLKKSMKQVAKGKQVIGSYKSSASVLNHPKVISVTN